MCRNIYIFYYLIKSTENLGTQCTGTDPSVITAAIDQSRWLLLNTLCSHPIEVGHAADMEQWEGLLTAVCETRVDAACMGLTYVAKTFI